MSESETQWYSVFQSPDRGQCMESRLVLEAVGIPNEVVHDQAGWALIVAVRDADRALLELEDYRRDNAVDQTTKPVTVRLFGGAGVGVFVYAATIILVAVAVGTPQSKLIWTSIGRMNAGQVMSGDWWRVVTALTLHVDLEHLLSNIAFGGFFGFLVGRILGGGVGWLAIVTAGSLGNLANAMMRPVEHSSIGASTAVFAALGAMVAHALKPRDAEAQTMLQRWRPLIGGVLLLAFVGVGGDDTDVGAHITGFVAGTVIGWIVCRLPDRALGNPKIQFICGFAAWTLVIVAWGIAIAHVQPQI